MLDSQDKRKSRSLVKTFVIAILVVFFTVMAVRVKRQRNITARKFIKAVTNSFGPMDGYFLTPNSEMCMEFEQTTKTKFVMDRESEFSSTWYKHISGELDHPTAMTGSIRIILPDDSVHECNRFALQPASPNSNERVMRLIKPNGQPFPGVWKKVSFNKCFIKMVTPGKIDIDKERDPNLVITDSIENLIGGGWSDDVDGVPRVTLCRKPQGNVYQLFAGGIVRAMVRSATCEITRVDKNGDYLGVITGATRLGGQLNYRVKFSLQPRRMVFQNVDGTEIKIPFHKVQDAKVACPKHEL